MDGEERSIHVDMEEACAFIDFQDDFALDEVYDF